MIRKPEGPQRRMFMPLRMLTHLQQYLRMEERERRPGAIGYTTPLSALATGRPKRTTQPGQKPLTTRLDQMRQLDKKMRNRKFTGLAQSIAAIHDGARA